MKSSRESKDRWLAKIKREQPERYRAMRRESQRRRRAKLYARGLTHNGQPVKRQDLADARRQHAPHPHGCPCYDCLFPPEQYRPTPHRAGIAS